MALRAWELTVLNIAEAAPVDPRRGTAGSPSLQHICFKYLRKTDSDGGCIAWVCTQQQPFHDWTRLEEGYRKFVSLWGVIYFILKGGLILPQHPRSQRWIDAAVLRESPAVALTSHRWRRSQSRRIRCLMAWKRGITVDHSGFIASYEPGGATRRRHERTGCRHGSGYITFKWGCYRFLFLEAGHRQHGEKSSTTASATAAGELVISVLWEVSVCRLGALCTHRSSRHWLDLFNLRDICCVLYKSLLFCVFLQPTVALMWRTTLTLVLCVEQTLCRGVKGFLIKFFPPSYFCGNGTDHTDVIGNASPLFLHRNAFCRVVARVFVFACRRTCRHSLVFWSSSTGSSEAVTARGCSAALIKLTAFPLCSVARLTVLTSAALLLSYIIP